MNIGTLEFEVSRKPETWPESTPVLVFVPQYGRYFQLKAADWTDKGLVLIAAAEPT